jgi:lysophospholipase L1-like esterase
MAFPRFNVLNRGFGGSQASDVLFFYDRIVPPYHPPLIVFYEGDNDLASGKSVDQVFGDWTNFVARVERDLPDTHILFVAVKPSPSRAHLLERQRTLNERIRDFNASRPNLHYADVFTPMLNALAQPRPELFVADALHLNAEGYEVWEAVLAPAVEDWARRYPVNIMKVERNALLIDLGASNTPSGAAEATTVFWNNVTSVGTSNGGVLTNLVTSIGAASSLGFEVISRFNGANENGTTSFRDYPASATRDSLFGNTEVFSGLANVKPVFRITGLDPTKRCNLTFYASRMSVGDNRETRYTVTGTGQTFADLDAANNVDQAAVLQNIQPSEDGTMTIALTPGPGNNNANHFTYLGVFRLEVSSPGGGVFLFDFGSSSSTTGTQNAPTAAAWNNLTPVTAVTAGAKLESLVATNGAITTIDLQILSRFNGSNENGSTNASPFPTSATRDSLFGNTETFGGFENLTPSFKLVNLDPTGTYSFRFYASRLGVTDNRETRYTVQGATAGFADLNAANNVDGLAAVDNIRPNPQNEITISLTPGTNNDNPNHFTYLGVLEMSWTIQPARNVTLAILGYDNQSLSLEMGGEIGVSYQLENSNDLVSWRNVESIVLTNNPVRLDVNPSRNATFYRVAPPN